MVLENYISNDYARAATILLIVLIIIKFGFTLIERFLIKITRKTKSDIDDIILQKSSKPITIISFLIGALFSFEELPISETVQKIAENLTYSAIVLSIAYLIFVILDTAILKGIDKYLFKSKIKINESLSSVIHETLRIILVILAFVYILDIWGVQIGPLLGALGIAGLAVALALQPALSNIFSGVSIVLDKSVRVGDWLVLEDGTWGTIDKIGIRSTKVRTFDNELIIIPNNKLADSRIHNVVLPEPKTRVVVPFSVAYGSDIEKIKSLILNEISKIKHSIKEPSPFVRFLEMGSSSLNFKAFFYVDSYEYKYSALDEANTKIYNALNKAGISIPFPQMDVHIKESKKKK